jgi:hypothetical protein
MRVVRPESITLPLSTGETLIVRKRLTAGERRAMLQAMRGPDGHGDGLLSGQAIVLAYLLDWTVKDEATNTPLVIRGKSRDEIRATLDVLEPMDAKEIERIIDQHDDAMIAAAAEEKKTRPGNGTSGSGSPSVNDGGSPTPTSTSSTPTSSTSA